MCVCVCVYCIWRVPWNTEERQKASSWHVALRQYVAITSLHKNVYCGRLWTSTNLYKLVLHSSRSLSGILSRRIYISPEAWYWHRSDEHFWHLDQSKLKPLKWINLCCIAGFRDVEEEVVKGYPGRYNVLWEEPVITQISIMSSQEATVFRSAKLDWLNIWHSINEIWMSSNQWQGVPS